MKLLFDCFYGVSGDMIVGALLDLGADQNSLKKVLKSLGLKDYQIKISKVKKGNITATDFDVVLSSDNHDHDMNFLFGDKEVNFEFKEKRRLSDIASLLEKSPMTERAKEIALKIFDVVAQAEGKAHGIPKENVIFHETGAMDSIIDIVSIAVCFDNLNISKAFVTNLREGQGQINTRVGYLPIPTPAVKNVLEGYGASLEICSLPFELITPTGISAIAVLTNFKNIDSKIDIIKDGFGSGKRDYGMQGTLRCCLFE